MPRTATPFEPLIEKVEAAEVLDAAAKPIAKNAREVLGPGPLKDALSGTWLGHPLHPVLTDVVIGSFLSATLLDLLGTDAASGAQERLIAVGIAAYGPTALTGVNDWADAEPTDDAVRRVGLVHAATNSVALGLYSSSLAARRRGADGKARLLSGAGAAVLGLGGFWGGHLTFRKGVGPNQTAFDQGPDEWTEAIGSDALKPDEPTAANVGDTPVLLVRHRKHVHAIHDRCSHRGCSLAGTGELDGETIECGCHGSRFRLRDGSVERGPATSPQPAYEVREQDGKVEIKLQSG